MHSMAIGIFQQMSHPMGKPTICICENKGADQLRSNCEADQRLCFRYSDSTIPPLLNSQSFKLLACFCACTGRFVSDLLGNHIVGFPTRRLKYHSLAHRFFSGWTQVFVNIMWVCTMYLYLYVIDKEGDIDPE